MATPEETAAAEAAKAAQDAEVAKVAAEAKVKADAEAAKKAAEEEVFDKDRAMATITKLRGIEEQAKKDAKELAKLKADAQARADAELTETERLKKQAETTAAENATLKADILRRDVIAETGLPAIFADRLKGTTREEMLADAKLLAETLPTLKAPPKVGATNPANGQQTETEAQMRERLFGHQGNAFDMASIKAGGGGVIWNQPKE